MNMTDVSIMPWGKYKGEKMANIPPDYLLWLIENNKCGGEVRKYIEDNEKTLIAEIALSKKMRGDK